MFRAYVRSHMGAPLLGLAGTDAAIPMAQTEG
jgi:hypothetical protein